jgi:predicted nucleic acid-binding protein
MAMAWFFEDKTTDRTRRVQDTLTSSRAIVPPLWATEVANVIALAEKKGRTDPALRRRWLEILISFPIDMIPYTNGEIFNRVIPLAIKEGLTVYDAVYLDLALQKRVALATFDATLASAAQRNGILVL